MPKGDPKESLNWSEMIHLDIECACENLPIRRGDGKLYSFILFRVNISVWSLSLSLSLEPDLTVGTNFRFLPR